jgi:hypothetical protein
MMQFIWLLGVDASHNPEFTTCEFYQAYGDFPELMSMTEQLVQGIFSIVTTSSRLISIQDWCSMSRDPIWSMSLARTAAGTPSVLQPLLPAYPLWTSSSASLDSRCQPWKNVVCRDYNRIDGNVMSGAIRVLTEAAP